MRNCASEHNSPPRARRGSARLQKPHKERGGEGMPGERGQRPHSRKPMPGHACAAASGRDRAAGCARACLRGVALTAASRLSPVDSSHIRGLSIVESTILGPPASLCASSRRILGAGTVDSTPIRPVFAKTASTRGTQGSQSAGNRRLELRKRSIIRRSYSLVPGCRTRDNALLRRPLLSGYGKDNRFRDDHDPRGGAGFLPRDSHQLP